MFLKENNFCIDYSKAYTDNEYLKILDALYSAEAYFVGVDEKKANRFADIADLVSAMGWHQCPPMIMTLSCSSF